MFSNHRIGIVIPALNEEEALGRVLTDLPSWIDRVIVVDNGSTDRTAEVARQHGATVVGEARRGYGNACLAGLTALAGDGPGAPGDIIAFLDADHSDHPEQLPALLLPIVENQADLVIGSRTLGRCEPGALSLPQRWGNAFACWLINRSWRHRYTDLGPFRAVRAELLPLLRMDDRTYGWTIQMQVRAVRAGLRIAEAPVDYRRRIGKSKISGTVSGVVRAGSKILRTIFDERSRPAPLVSTRPHSVHVMVFTRYPEPGRTKTRLIPVLGAGGAAELQRQMTLHTLAMTDRFRGQCNASVEVRYTGGSAAQMRQAFGDVWAFRGQHEGDLGKRMHAAFAESFARGAKYVIAIGCDCPALEPRDLESAAAALQRHDVVLGPAADGGYYLVGLRRPCAELFQGIDWGTSGVCHQTRSRAALAGMSLEELSVRADVDDPDDLTHWQANRERYLLRGRIPRLSVIIPTRDEETLIARAIVSARATPDVEVIVADSPGAPGDRTAEIAAALGARVVRSEPGRACQMNAGARAARGQVLLFLHADSVLPGGYLESVTRGLASPDVALTAFRLHIEPAFRGRRWLAGLANFRARWFAMPYGDQAYAVRAETFRRLGGFPRLPIMEDFEFVRRARRIGRVVSLDHAVQTSGRRWLRHGVVRTTLINQLCVAGYLLGVPVERIAKWRNGNHPSQIVAAQQVT